MIQHIERHIDNLKSKPEHIRKRFAFTTSLTISIIILLVWIASYGIKSEIVANGVEVKPPMGTLSASVGDIWTYVKGIFSGGNKAEYSATQIDISAGDR